MELEFEDGMMVKNIFEELKYHPASVAPISLNGKTVDENAALKDGDEIVLVPAVGGGSR